MMFLRRNTFRRYNLIVEISSFLLAGALLLLMVWVMQRQMGQKYLDLRIAEAARVPLFLESHISTARQTLLDLVRRPGSSSLRQTDLALLHELSDIYRLDARLHIAEVYKSSVASRVFVGFSFAQSKLSDYLHHAGLESGYPGIVRGYEDDAPSIYLALPADDGQGSVFLARLDLGYMRDFLRHYAEFSASPIYIVAQDGFVMLSGSPGLAIPSFHLKEWADKPLDKLMLSAGGRNWIPIVSEAHAIGAKIVTLVPTEMLEIQRNVLLVFLGIFFVGLVGLGVFKKIQMDRFIFQPIAAFAHNLQELAQGRRVLADELGIYRFEELAEIQQHFLSMAQAIREREHSILQQAEQLRAVNARLEELATTDGLTGIANRRHFDEVLAVEFSRLSQSDAVLSLLLLDIDHFKLFNDTYGHVVGDDCLRQVGRLMASSVHRVSDLAARYGGEEFAAILLDTDAAGAADLAESIRAGIENLAISHQTSCTATHVTASVGVVTVRPACLASVEAVITLADEQLYAAKAAGRNRVTLLDMTPAEPSRPSF